MQNAIGFGTFDYIVLIYLLWQAYIGYQDGFEKIVYDTIKYVVIIGGVYLSNKYVWPQIMSSDTFVSHITTINEFGTNLMMNFAPKDNVILSIMYENIIKNIPYDKIVYYGVVIIIIIVATRILIYGSLTEEGEKKRTLGAIVSFIKGAMILFAIYMAVCSIVMKFNVDVVKGWEEKSIILKFVNITEIKMVSDILLK